MRAVAAYLAVGMVLTGFGAGLYMKRCPTDQITAGDFAATVLFYPAMFIAVVVANKSPSACVTGGL